MNRFYITYNNPAFEDSFCRGINIHADTIEEAIGKFREGFANCTIIGILNHM